MVNNQLLKEPIEGIKNKIIKNETIPTKRFTIITFIKEAFPPKNFIAINKGIADIINPTTIVKKFIKVDSIFLFYD